MKKFIIKIWLFSAVLPLVIMPLVVYNFWIDPFGVLRSNMQNQKTEPNQHYLKIKYCTANPKKHEAFLFGSSRVGKIDVSKIPDTNNWYNFTYSECVPFETLQDIKYLLNHNVEIKKIIIGLDEISYLVSPELHKSQSLRKPYVNSLNPYLYYLFLRPSISMYSSIMNADTSKFYSKGAYKIIYLNGSFSPNKKDTFIEKNPLFHKKDRIFNKPNWGPHYRERINKTVSEIKEIKEICNKHSIEVKFFINPIYQKTYMKAVDNKFFVFLYKLSTITEYYDFSGINKITTNPYYYYESSHYRPVVGDILIKKMFDLDTKAKFRHFGYIVNKSNVDSIINIKKIEIEKYRNTISKAPTIRLGSCYCSGIPVNKTLHCSVKNSNL